MLFQTFKNRNTPNMCKRSHQKCSMSIRNETEYIEGLTDKRNPRGLDNINYAPIQHTGKGNRGNKNYR